MVAMVSSNLPQGSAQVAVAERIEQYGGKLEPVVEDASLDLMLEKNMNIAQNIYGDGNSAAKCIEIICDKLK